MKLSSSQSYGDGQAWNSRMRPARCQLRRIAVGYGK
jgi:hypothetical protein